MMSGVCRGALGATMLGLFAGRDAKAEVGTQRNCCFAQRLLMSPNCVTWHDENAQQTRQK